MSDMLILHKVATCKTWLDANYALLSDPSQCHISALLIIIYTGMGTMTYPCHRMENHFYFMKDFYAPAMK